MKLQIPHPLEPFVILQGFGVNGAYYQAHGINIKGHNGLDLKAYHGQPIYAVHDGTALYQVDSGQGHGVILITDVPYDYEGSEEFGYSGGTSLLKTVYWHMCDPIKEPKFKSPIADKGAVQIKKGDLLGYADSTGFSTSDHLHFAIKPVAKIGENLYTWGNTLNSNGYSGCIDPMPYFESQIYVQELQAKKISLMRQLLTLLYQKYKIITGTDYPNQT